ncbi:MAG: hypothetical protein IH628_15850, partial [Proteobacteria bacterium]|nr:hypothetical protein [Pseudomonadota bacterium]
MYRILVLALLATSAALAQQDSLATSPEAADSLFLQVVIPGQDTVRADAGRHRIAASTIPTARAFINGSEARVYPSGA